LQGGTFTGSATGNEDSTTFTTLDSAVQYIYNGNNFDQPHEEGWCEELYPTDFLENVRIRVQTNPAGSTVDPIETRTFQINVFDQYDIEESIAIAQSSQAVVQTTVSETDTTIPLVNASMMTVPAHGEDGIAWIGTERITYGAIDGNSLLYVTRGTYGTSAQQHLGGTFVQDASIPLQIPTPARFSDYGDNLRMAYNDSGVSLSTAGTTPEHAFIRNAGFGTL